MMNQKIGENDFAKDKLAFDRNHWLWEQLISSILAFTHIATLSCNTRLLVYLPSRTPTGCQVCISGTWKPADNVDYR